MEDQYGMADLRHYINGRPLFHSIPQPPDLLSSHRGLSSAAAPHPYDMLIFRSDSAAATNTNAGFAASSSGAAGQCFNGFENGPSGGDGGAGRWPRQETLTLLEIRSRLDPKFKEANQKGPLWDEVSRIMSEEHGYQRGGKKCREKFENLYKYYKKTKEGKAGRQDGKHYRFFRQLEALYGEANSSVSMSEAHLAGGAAYHSNFSYKSQLLAQNHEPSQGAKLSDTSLSLSNYSEADTTSSEDSDELGINNQCGKIKKRSGWKMKIKDFIDARMKKLMEKQEAWMEKMMRTIEDKERERRMREDEWRKQDAMRIEREHKFWASEREWIEAQNNALMDALHKLTGTAPPPQEAAAAAEIRSLSENIHNDDVDGSETTAKGGDVWPECEINTLIQMRTAVGGVAEEIAWEEVSTKMACFGYERSAAVCKEKWDSVNNYAIKCSKKRKEDSKSCTYFHSHDSISNQGRGGGGGGGGGVYSDHTNEQGNADHHHHHHHNISPNQNGAEAISESCFRYFMGDAY